MVFYSNKRSRKIIFRITAVSLTLLFIFLIFDFGLSVVYSKNEDNYTKNTKDFYEYYRGSQNNKKIALTFDDGPTEQYTLKIMDILKKNNVPATFFFVGKNVAENEDIVKKAYDDGFEIGNHSYTHRKYIYKKEKYLKWELTATSNLIKSITGEKTILYRPPYLFGLGGDPTINPNVKSKVQLKWAAENGFIPVGVDVDPKDYLANSPEELLNNLKKVINNGKIVLLHDGTGEKMGNTLASLDSIISYLKSQGYEFVKVSELLGVDKDYQSGLRFDDTLYYSDSDEYTNKEVSRLQEFLLTENSFEYPHPTGYYGNITKRGLKRWQEKHGITVSEENNSEEISGKVVDEQTKREIFISSLKNKKELKSNSYKKFSNILLWENFSSRFVIFLSSISVFVFWILYFVIFLVLFRIIFFLALFVYTFFKKKKSDELKKIYNGSVDVVVPAWNEEENIKATILSLLKNDYVVNKIIVVDDCSTDRTAEIVENIRKKNIGKIELIRLEKNGGKANALNVGFRTSKSDVVIALDADTIFLKNTISNLVKHFEDEEVYAVAGNVRVVKSMNLLSMFQSIEYIIGQNIEKNLLANLNAVGVVPGAVGAWRRSAVIKLGGYSKDTLVEDQDLTLKILKNRKKVVYEPTAISYTETPRTLGVFMKQRFRWVYGTIQCFWKNKGEFKNKKYSPMSYIILPNILIYSIIIPLLSPIADFIAVAALIFGSWQKVALAYLVFTLVDVLYASLAFVHEKGNRYLLFIIPLQRIYYRQILYIVLIKSIVKAIEGSYTSWTKIQKKGFAQKYYLKAIEK